MIQTYPLVTGTGKEKIISLTYDSMDEAFFREIPILKYVGEDGRFSHGYPAKNEFFQSIPVSTHKKDERVVSFTFTFLFEGEHHFFLFVPGEDKPFFSFNIYSLENDYLALKPYKGDFHMHSNRSDGVDEPIVVAASCRKIGLDFMALTDHKKMPPSHEVMDWISRYETDLRCYPGEEVHPPDNPVHIINFGGKVSVNTFMEQNKDLYQAEVALMQAKGDHEREELSYQKASTRWTFKKIKETGGISMYCHPYWRWNERYYVSRPLHEHIMDNGDFDVLEVIGGFHPFELESNALQVALYEDYRARGKAYPAAGVSDSHDCSGNLFGWYYTLVFAGSSDFMDLADSLRKGLCLAVSAVPGEFPRLTGPFRLVKLGYFLLREYFPVHDALCLAEGEKLLSLAEKGDSPLLEKELEQLKGQVPAYLKKCWDQTDI